MRALELPLRVLMDASSERGFATNPDAVAQAHAALDAEQVSRA
ncbi:MAG TPA: hypothetical protein VI197_26615 [Polyangiaceae bacterium]